MRVGERERARGVCVCERESESKSEREERREVIRAVTTIAKKGGQKMEGKNRKQLCGLL